MQTDDGDADFVQGDGFDKRGWSMRHGHCRRLRASTGRESVRGRACYARSINQCPRNFGGGWEPKKQRRSVFYDGGGAHVDFDSESAESFDPFDEEDWTEWEIPPIEWFMHHLEEECHVEHTIMQSGLGNCVKQVATTRWDDAVLRAKIVAGGYTYARQTVRRDPPRQAAAKKGAIREDAIWLEKLRQQFLVEHGSAIRQDFGSVFKGEVEMRKAPVSPIVVRNFADSYFKAKAAKLLPVYHGTDAKNHESIFRNGLLVPNTSVGVRSRNGMSHGNGVYTSTVSNAWLSKGFCTEPRMLVCAVLDDATPLNFRKIIGNFQVTRESPFVRHIGAAIVVFDSRRLIPLFEAVAENFKSGVLAPARIVLPPVVPLAAPSPSASHLTQQPRGKRVVRKFVRVPDQCCERVSHALRRAAQKRRC